MKIFKFLMLGLLLQGCNIGSENKITMPIYQECLSNLEEYITSSSRYRSVSFKVDKFDITSDAHPFIIGFITVSGNSKKEFELSKNSVKSLCLPSAMIATDRDWRGVERMIKRYDRLRAGGDAYLDITKDRISVFYNQKLNENAESVLPPSS